MFIEAPLLPVYLVKVFSVLGPQGFPQTFDVWDEMKNEMLFNKQSGMSEYLLNKKGQTLGEVQLRDMVHGCRPDAQTHCASVSTACILFIRSHLSIQMTPKLFNEGKIVTGNH